MRDDYMMNDGEDLRAAEGVIVWVFVSLVVWAGVGLLLLDWLGVL